MMCLSGHTGKEAQYVNSCMRGQTPFVFISSGAGFGHECLSHGPLFSALGRLDQRPQRAKARRWSLSHLHFTALPMIYTADEALKDRFGAARRCVVDMFPGRRVPGRSYQGFIKAQKRISPKMVEHLKDHLRGHHRRVAGRFWERLGWVPFACDGSRVEVPRTPRNKELGCTGRKKTGPQLFVTTLYYMGTGLPWDWQIGKGTASERDHLRAMLAAGMSFLIRAGSNVSLLTQLNCEVGNDGQTVWLWPQDQRRSSPPLKLRLIRLKGVSGSAREVCLLTNVFDHERLPDETAAILYRMRWGVEVFTGATSRRCGSGNCAAMLPSRRDGNCTGA